MLSEFPSLSCQYIFVYEAYLVSPNAVCQSVSSSNVEINAMMT